MDPLIITLIIVGALILISAAIAPGIPSLPTKF